MVIFKTSMTFQKLNFCSTAHKNKIFHNQVALYIKFIYLFIHFVYLFRFEGTVDSREHFLQCEEGGVYLHARYLPAE